MTNNAFNEKTLKLELDHLLNEPLEVAEHEISEKLAELGRPINIVIPKHDTSKYWQIYKDIVSFLISLSSKEVKLFSDTQTYELCLGYTAGNLRGDIQAGYFLDIP